MEKEQITGQVTRCALNICQLLLSKKRKTLSRRSHQKLHLKNWGCHHCGDISREIIIPVWFTILIFIFISPYKCIPRPFLSVSPRSTILLRKQILPYTLEPRRVILRSFVSAFAQENMSFIRFPKSR